MGVRLLAPYFAASAVQQRNATITVDTQESSGGAIRYLMDGAATISLEYVGRHNQRPVK